MERAWCIWYDDNTSYSHTDGPWKDAPVDGVLAVGLIDDGIRRIYSGNDFYLQESGSLFSFSQAHLERNLRRLIPGMKYGRWAPDDQWAAIQREVSRWP